MAAKRGALALIGGGALWALVMVAYIMTHGPGTYDYKRLLFGLSRDNYLLLHTPAALLLAYGLSALRTRFQPLTGRLFSGAGLTAVVLLGLFAAGNLGFTAQIGVGQHPPWPQNDVALMIPGIVQGLSLFPLGLSLALMGVSLLLARQFRSGAALLLLIGLVALAPWQAVHGYPGVAFGVAWAALGAFYTSAQGGRPDVSQGESAT